MRLQPLLMYGLPILTIVNSLSSYHTKQENNATTGNFQISSSQCVFSREKRTIISADFQNAYDIHHAPQSGSVALVISASILIFHTIGYMLAGNRVYPFYLKSSDQKII